MKKLLSLLLIATIPAVVVNPALAAAPQTITPGATAKFPTNAFAGKTRLCAQTNDGHTGTIDLKVGAGQESVQVGPQQNCITRKWGGLPLFVTNGGGSQSITVFTS
ncbi:MAG: hypothetical protein PUP93_31285 [Rhizonema sp. NSF051]|nr:hypothetical protein [Rhizonema sp. NSF051]